MMGKHARTLGFLLVLLLSACASMGTHGAERFATLVIDNDNTMNVNIYAMRGDMRMRIGMVPGVSTREFPLRLDMLTSGGDLHLAIDPIGSPRTYPATPILVREGDTIELRVSAFIR